MGSYTTAMPSSFKAELPQGLHNFTQNTGDVFKVALGKPTPTGTYGAATTNYSDLTGSSDEVPAGGGYATGGFAFTAAQNVTPQLGGTTAFWQWSVNPSWSGATFECAGVLIYNSSKGDRAVYVGDLGGAQQVSSGSLTLVLPTNDANNALLRIQ